MTDKRAGMDSGMTTGKAPPELLARLFADVEDSRVIQGPGIGRDAAVVEWGGRAMVVSSDPITFAAADADSNAARLTARLAVTVNANDIHALGAEPEWMLATVLAPDGIPAGELSALLDGLHAACREAGVALVGGHTEVTDAVSRTVVACTMIGSAALEQIVPSDGARNGDVIIQAGAAAVEGTAILGHEGLLDDPGISVAAVARALRDIDGVHAMHDVTEGGIATAALELAEAAGLRLALDADAVIWLPQTLDICRARGLDPLGLLGSGTLLAASAPDAASDALAALERAGVQAAVIGTVAAGIRATISHGGRSHPLPRFTRDEALRDARHS